MHHHLEEVETLPWDLTPKPIQEELTCVEGEGSSHILHLSDTKVLAELENWVPNTGHTQARFNQYMHTIDLYWHMKFLLGRILIDRQMKCTEELPKKPPSIGGKAWDNKYHIQAMSTHWISLVDYNAWCSYIGFVPTIYFWLVRSPTVCFMIWTTPQLNYLALLYVESIFGFGRVSRVRV